MKKIIIAALFATVFSGSVSAQEKGNIEFGVNAGLNYSFATNSQYQTETGYGLNVGASLEYYFSDRWGIKGKLIYDQKGWNKDLFTDSMGNDYVSNINLNYITIPVMANWHFAPKRNWYLNFGPYVGFLVSAEETARGVDIKDAFKSTDYGFAYGIGVKLPVSDRMKLSFEFEGQGGLTDIFEEDNFLQTVTNSRGSFNIGLAFLLK